MRVGPCHDEEAKEASVTLAGEPEDGRLGDEQPEADVLDQRREEVAPMDPELEPIDELPVEANEADALEQHRIVPVPDED
jgi:hypothetical protein